MYKIFPACRPYKNRSQARLGSQAVHLKAICSACQDVVHGIQSVWAGLETRAWNEVLGVWVLLQELLSEN